MLGQRVVTAVVLLAILLPAIFLAPPWVWGLVSLALLAVASAEWGRLLGSANGGRLLGAALAAGGGAYVTWRSGSQAPGAHAFVTLLSAASLALWVSVAPLSLARVRRVGSGWVVAAISLAACWLALYELRLDGAGILVSCLAIVWLADIGAYFAGRAFGRRKLAPRISPGKSWEGVAGGMVAVIGVALAVALAWPGTATGDGVPRVFSSWLAAQAGWPVSLAVLAAIAGLSVVGDLHESLLKRLAGVKDSGRLLPGHGGVLDRIDALIPTMPGCLLLLQLLR